MKAVSGHCSRTTDLNIKFTCFLVTPNRKRYDSDVPQPDAFTGRIGAMGNREIAAWGTALSHDIAHMTITFIFTSST
jgi:hypothetical protein